MSVDFPLSVVMPVYNSERFIDEAIRSILEQTFNNFEFIIINDASTDSTKKIIMNYRDKRIHLLNNNVRRGVAYSLNRGLMKAKGHYIARMDADDLAEPYRFQTQLNYFKKNHQVVAIGSWVEYINSKRKKIIIKKVPLNYREIKRVLMKFNPIIHPTVMIKKSVLDNIGYYSEKYNGAEDYDLFLRMACKYNIANLPLVLLKYRITSDSVSLNKTKYIEFQSLRVRINALISYGYPFWQSIYLIKPLISFLIPSKLKRFYYNFRYEF